MKPASHGKESLADTKKAEIYGNFDCFFIAVEDAKVQMLLKQYHCNRLDESVVRMV